MPAQREPKYLIEKIESMGSWNPDGDLTNLAPNEFSDARNIRQETPGIWELRSNYRDKTTFDSASPASAAEILCSTEYRFIDDNNAVTLFDVVCYQQSNLVKIYALNRSPIALSTLWLTSDKRNILPSLAQSGDLFIQLPSTDPVRAFCVQYGSYIIVTVYGIGVFSVYPIPVGSDPNRADDWFLRPLGKDVASAPENIEFDPSFDGDLFIVLYDDDQREHVGQVRYAHHITPKALLPGTEPTSIFPPFQFVRIPVGATYYLFDNFDTAGNNGIPLRRWVANAHDPAIGGNSVETKFHLQDRSWGYRTVFVHKFIDGRGNHITYRSAPSVDFWVPNMVYIPPQVFDSQKSTYERRQQFSGNNSPPPQPPPQGWLNSGQAESSFFIFEGPVDDSTDETAIFGVNGERIYPSVHNAMTHLGKKIIAFNGQTWNYGSPGYGPDVATGFDESVWLPTMAWMGFRRMWNPSAGHPQSILEEYDFDASYKCPYFCEIPADQLASAPLTRFKWSMFSSVPADVTEIEFYRTAYAGTTGTIDLPDGNGNVQTQPLFQPHLYGYVGSLKKPIGSGDTKWTDTVKDEDIDFGSQPKDYNGKAPGDFSGAVVEEYVRADGVVLALGDIATTYRVLAPWDDYQLFIYGPGSSAVSPVLTGTKKFYLRYVDQDGNISALTLLPVFGYKADNSSSTGWGFVAAMIPVGYVAFVSSIELIFFDGTDYRLVKSIAPTDGYVIATDVECNTGEVVADITASAIVTKEPGSMIWSAPNDIFAFSPGNYLQVHTTAAITALKSILGELFVFSEKSISLTNLNGRFEEENKSIGCVGRFAAVKVDKIIFFLSQAGLYFCESSGIVMFPGFVETLIRPYIQEIIPNTAPLTNASRSALGWLANRKELWLYLPGTDDLGGSLRARCIVYKMFRDLYGSALDFRGNHRAESSSAINYEFEVLASGNPAYPAGVYDGSQSRVLPLIFTPGSDGQMFTEFKNESTHLFHTLLNDAGENFLGDAYLERPAQDPSPGLSKQFRSIEVNGGFAGNFYIRTGAPRPDGIRQYDTGMVWTPSTEWAYSNNNQGFNETYNHRIQTNDVAQSTSYIPIMRWRSSANDGAHRLSIASILLYFDILHQHPL